MSGPPRTVRYEGLYPSQIRERFEQDAADAAADDWYPTSESWQGGVLSVVYEHDPERAHRSAVAPLPGGPHDPGPRTSTHDPADRVRLPLAPWDGCQYMEVDPVPRVSIHASRLASPENGVRDGEKGARSTVSRPPGD